MKISIKAVLVILGLLFIAYKPRTECGIVQGHIKAFTDRGIEIELNELDVGVTLVTINMELNTELEKENYTNGKNQCLIDRGKVNPTLPKIPWERLELC